ncbi:hypothetical protein LSH36_785g02022 [Paralvinella palmiformis]|uniref:Uncharacterized protein n=1 Tax=Paralvinella palmiformis TaxID=53620 RepID=A0AAD9J189_9ANNE|nr:hypothetical protein LSH36_785g02022 [Paralvinella palmiformis]
MNSIRYSTMSANEKHVAFSILHKEWLEFIEKTVTIYNL